MKYESQAQGEAQSWQDSFEFALKHMQDEVDAYCHVKGWRVRGGVSFGEAMALLHSEVSEAFEAYRSHGMEKGVGSEFADILIRLLDDCALFGVDLAAEYRAKMDYNWTRAYRHGGKSL